MGLADYLANAMPDGWVHTDMPQARPDELAAMQSLPANPTPPQGASPAESIAMQSLAPQAPPSPGGSPPPMMSAAMSPNVPQNLAAAYASQADGYPAPQAAPMHAAASPPRSLAQAPGYGPVNPQAYAYEMGAAVPSPDMVSGATNGGLPPPSLMPTIRRPAPGGGPAAPNVARPLGNTVAGNRADAERSRLGEINSMGETGQSIQREADAHAAGIDAQAAGSVASAAVNRAAAVKTAENSAQEQRTLGSFLAAQDAERLALSQAKTDPFRIIRNEGVANKLLRAFGGLLGGAAAGLKGGPNQFSQHIDHLMDLDIASQESGFRNRKDALAMGDSMYAKLRGLGESKQVADLQYKDLLLHSITDYTQSIVQSTNSKVTKEQGLQAIQELQRKSLETRAQLAQAKASQISQDAANTAMAQYNAAKRIMELQKTAAEVGKTEAETAKLTSEARNGTPENQLGRERLQYDKDKDAEGRYSAYGGVVFHSPQDKAEYEKKAQAVSGFLTILDQAEQLKKEYRVRASLGLPTDEISQRAEGLAANARQYAAGEQGTVLREFSQGNMDKIAGEITHLAAGPSLIHAERRATASAFLARAKGARKATPEEIAKYGGSVDLMPLDTTDTGATTKP